MAQKQLTKRTEKRAEKPMAEAPRDRTLVELIPVRGKPYIGYFDPGQGGWVDWGDLVPLIRQDPDFVGWRPRRVAKGSLKKAL